MSGERVSSHDHGNCELCDEQERERDALARERDEARRHGIVLANRILLLEAALREIESLERTYGADAMCAQTMANMARAALTPTSPAAEEDPRP